MKVEEIEKSIEKLEGHWKQREQIQYLLSYIHELKCGIRECMVLIEFFMRPSTPNTKIDLGKLQKLLEEE